MNTLQLSVEIRGFIKDNFLYGRDDPNFTDNTSFLEKGIIDSTGVLELVSFVEQTYGISVADEDLIPDNFDSVNKVSLFINGKMNGGKCTTS